jgi:hypothetical protein
MADLDKNFIEIVMAKNELLEYVNIDSIDSGNHFEK